MPKRYPEQFKRDVVAVARRGDLSIAEVAVDFSVAEESVRRWVRQADIDDGVKDGLTSAEQAEVVQLRRRLRRLEMPERDLAQGCGVFRQGDAVGKMMYPLVRESAAEGFPVRSTCGVLGFSAQAYYAWAASPVSARDWADAHATNALVDAHRDDPGFGLPAAGR